MVDLRDGLQGQLGPGFSIERELAGGGMARVFVALDGALGRRVVVKVLPPDLAATVSVERFKREILLAATLQHPHIVGVLSAGEIDGMPYFTMPFVEGESLRARIQREGPLAVGRCVSILKDVARALQYAHERGVVHRDIKPDNVLLAGNSATVTDFGIAKALLGAIQQPDSGERAADSGQRIADSGQRTAAGTTTSKSALTQLGTTLGTPAYMAPEQAAADPATDHRADVYAFGIMAYEMLTGEVPFKSKTPQALLAAQLTASPPPIASRRADVPVALARLVMQCLEKEREKRPQSAQEIAERLEHPDMVSGAFASASMDAATARRGRWLGVLAAVAVAATSLLVWWQGTRPGSGRAGAAAKAAAAAELERSIVVMPFVNIGPDTTDDYLADGLTNDLINALGRVSGLLVASRSVALSARTRFSSPQELGKALNVGRILEGTVQRDGNRLRVTARVINTVDGFMAWSDTYDSELKDVFRVQDEISKAIADALGAQIQMINTLVAMADSLATVGTDDYKAYDLYLRGRHDLEQRGAVTLRRALDFFQKAVQRDSRFARAWAGMAAAYSVMPIYGAMSPDSAAGPGLAAATRAIAIDTALAEAWASRAVLLNGRWRWAEADRDFQHALQLDPRYAAAHQWYGEHLMTRGRLREAVDHLRRAAELDPLSPVIAGSYSMALALSRRDAEAVAEARRAIDLDSSLFVPRLMLGFAHVVAGRSAEGLRALEPAVALSGGSPYASGALGYAYAAEGQQEGAAGVARDLAARSDADSRAALSMVQAGLGDTTAALASLETAVRAHATFFTVLPLAAPIFDPLRRSARFRGVQSILGLTP